GSVLSFGLAVSMAAFSAVANFAAFRNSALAYVLLRVPVGTVPQPLVLPTSSMYSLDVAQLMNFCASGTCLEPDGIASAQAHSQFAPFGVTAVGAWAKATLSATWDCLGSLIKLAAIVASTHMPHLPELNSARISLKLLADEPGGPYFLSRSTRSEEH